MLTDCRATHPSLPADRRCQEPRGHDGPHVVNDGCGRPEFYWRVVPLPTEVVR